jgi:predicted nucleic acid-binding protein
MNDKIFIDSNILLYAYSKSEPLKRHACTEALVNEYCCTSTQAINEFCNVCIKKWYLTATETACAVNEISLFCKVYWVYNSTIKKALQLNEKYRYSYYDCLMLASAIENGCDKVFSEDMQDGQIIEDRLRIINILKSFSS